MKRNFILSILAVLMLLPASALNAQKRENILKVYNWADYIDEDLIPEFEAWYKEQTGEDVKVVYQLFDINEVMLSKIEKGHEDYDVVCPSDYIIERMLRLDLLLPIDKDFGETPNYIDQNLSPYIVARFNDVDGNGKNANDYAVGYMWGTNGIMYNQKYVTKEEASSWSILANEKFKGKIFMKDAFRDVYAPLLIYLKKDEIDAGKVTMDELMYDTSEESIALVENFLMSIKDNIAGWEVDFGKEFMTQEKGYVNLAWSGDASWAIEEAEQVNVSLNYVIPKEGSIVWFDGLVIPKYAKNVKAARYFINFMCRSDNAIRNMEAIGYVSAIGTQEVIDAFTDESLEETVDVSYFFGENATALKLNPVQFPDKSDIDLCAMEHDSGDRTEYLLAMWSRVKGDSANSFTYIIIGAVIVVFVIYAILRKNKKNKKKARKNAKK